MKKHEYKKPEPIYIKDKGLPLALMIFVFIVAPIILTITLNYQYKKDTNEIKQQNQEYVVKITQDEKLAEALRYGCINAPRLFKFNTCDTIFEITNK